MSKTVQIVCDGCGADLTHTGNCVDYRLALLNQSIPSRGGVVTMMGIYPKIDEDAYFCDLICLDHWSSRRHHVNALWKVWWDEWKDEYGSKDETGRVLTYPDAPQETKEAREAEFKAAALAAFPMKYVR